MRELLDINPAPADPAASAQRNFELIDSRLSDFIEVTYAASIALDFSNQKTRIIELTGNLTLTTTSDTLAPGRAMSIEIVADGSLRNLTFPGGWKFLGGAAPTDIAAGKTGLLELWSRGTSDADIRARWTVEP